MQSSAVAEERAADYLVEPCSDANTHAASAQSPFIVGVTAIHRYHREHAPPAGG